MAFIEEAPYWQLLYRMCLLCPAGTCSGAHAGSMAHQLAGGTQGWA